MYSASNVNPSTSVSVDLNNCTSYVISFDCLVYVVATVNQCQKFLSVKLLITPNNHHNNNKYVFFLKLSCDC